MRRLEIRRGHVSTDANTWYKDAVIYEVHVRAFRDSNGDGIGDLAGLTQKLDYIKDLGATAIWLLPFYPSPLRDDGYDISDYRRVHRDYGTLGDFRTLLREAHHRQIRVITELVLAHTSDEHPWFQRARRARPGSSARDFYVWSDTSDRYRDARVIFKDFETSNWAFDPMVGQYYWHRFYAHQPSLNYHNPAVRAAMFDVVDFWFATGVDGLRLDAVPYLYAREGTSSENLPETIAFLAELRAHVDDRYPGKMLLAEANQWPEDAVAYFGEGDICHMAFHFPLMPRMFMAARQEDRFPIVDIFAETPAIPEDCQWALFLRNHDELTLEMVTDEERDYMYRAYAEDPQARINVGIRRRLAPLLGNDRKLIEMMNGLMFSLPGTPIVYYGDEIGMGDNIYLGDRNGVRTPMQWDGDRNAGFSSANPQRLYLPTIIDPEYHMQSVNVAAQQENSNSLLWWMRRLVALRNHYHAFARGTFELLRPDNRKVLAFIRRVGDEVILVAVNLSRFSQGVELDLSEFRNLVPVELFGTTEFPAVGDLPYFLTLGPHGFYWFALEHREEPERAHGRMEVADDWLHVLDLEHRELLENNLATFLPEQRWFGDKSRGVRGLAVTDSFTLPGLPGTNGATTAVVVVHVDFVHGAPAVYLVPLAFVSGERAADIVRFHGDSIIGELRAGGEDGLLVDAKIEPGFAETLVAIVTSRRQLAGAVGRAVGVPSSSIRRLVREMGPDPSTVVIGGDQSNTSILVGGRVVVKLLRRVEEGINPAVELGRFLSARRFASAPEFAGHLEYRDDPLSTPATLALLEAFVPNEADGWSYVLDALTHGLEEVIASAPGSEPRTSTSAHLLEAAAHPIDEGDVLVGPHLQWAEQLGRRTAELHLVLACEPEVADFAPELLGATDRQAMFHGARSSLRQSLRAVRALPIRGELVEQVLSRDADILAKLSVIREIAVRTTKIRGHGDYHLGQVLWTGKDFVIIDFEGEPARSLPTRRLKRTAFVDVAGMIRSFDYVARVAASRLAEGLLATRDPALMEPYLTAWYRRIAGVFLRSYLEEAAGAPFVPVDHGELTALLEFSLLEKAIYELGYEANHRPDWIDLPARGILDLLGP